MYFLCLASRTHPYICGTIWNVYMQFVVCLSFLSMPSRQRPSDTRIKLVFGLVKRREQCHGKSRGFSLGGRRDLEDLGLCYMVWDRRAASRECGFVLGQEGVILGLVFNKSYLGRWNEAPVSPEFLDRTDFLGQIALFGVCVWGACFSVIFSF